MDVTLPCPYTVPSISDNDIKIEWYKTSDGRSRIVQRYGTRYRTGGQYRNRIHLSTDDGDGSLTLSTIQPSDAGRYECTVSIGGKDNVLHLSLQVSYPGGLYCNIQ